MGLAASQARFLAITSRKMNCEFQSMQIAQQKLSVTRDLQKASQDYQTNLQATKLVWDTMDDDVYDLSYDIMMQPSAINQYDPYLVTDTNGKIVLTDTMFNAAVAAGVITSDGSPVGNLSEGIKNSTTDGSRNAFLYQLGVVNQIDGSIVNSIQNLPNSYTKSGIGGEIYDKSTANALTTTAFINYLKEAKYGEDGNDQSIKTVKKGSTFNVDIIRLKPEVGSDGKVPPDKVAGSVLYKSTAEATKDTNILLKTYKAGDVVDMNCYRSFAKDTVNNSDADIIIDDITWKPGEKLTKDVTINLNGIKAPETFTIGVLTDKAPVKKGDSIYNVNLYDALGMDDKSLRTSKDFDNSKTAPAEQFIVTQNGQALSEESLKKLTLGDILSGKYELSYKGKDETEVKNVMIKALETMAKSLGYGALDQHTGLNVDVESDLALDQAFEFTKALLNSKTSNNGTVSSRCTSAQGVNQLVYGNNIGTISLTNMLKSFLTNFAIAIDGFDCGFSVEKDDAKKSQYVTNDLNYYFLLKNDGAMTDQTMLVADFYNMLYNQLCVNGACSDSNKRDLINDKDYLAHALKNGQLFVSSLNNDGYFYQGAYTLNGHVSEVPDEEARTQAELDYNIKKSKLNYKEETLELQMKSLDAEISALTTEYDTVKGLISKGIEKVFTMFSS